MRCAVTSPRLSASSPSGASPRSTLSLSLSPSLSLSLIHTHTHIHIHTHTHTRTHTHTHTHTHTANNTLSLSFYFSISLSCPLSFALSHSLFLFLSLSSPLSLSIRYKQLTHILFTHSKPQVLILNHKLQPPNPKPQTLNLEQVVLWEDLWFMWRTMIIIFSMLWCNLPPLTPNCKPTKTNRHPVRRLH